MTPVGTPACRRLQSRFGRISCPWRSGRGEIRLQRSGIRWARVRPTTWKRSCTFAESIGIGPQGEAYTTGTGCQVYRIDLASNTAEQFASTEARCLGQAVDADGNLYAAQTIGGGDGIDPGPDPPDASYSRAPRMQGAEAIS